MTRIPFTISTPRLLLREFTAEDAAPLFELNSDPEVLRYTGDDPFSDVSAAADFIRSYEEYERHGFGRWSVMDRATGDFLGFCGLERSAMTGEADLGFRFFQRYWAKGFATEAASASLSAGFEQFGLAEITGRAMRENLPSISVLQKLGLRFREVAEEGDLIWLIYAINALTYLDTRS